MNERLHKFIGKPITVVVKLFVNDFAKEEYVQGILNNIKDDILFIDQYVPFCNLFVKDAETIKIEIRIQDTTPNQIKLF